MEVAVEEEEQNILYRSEFSADVGLSDDEYSENEEFFDCLVEQEDTQLENIEVGSIRDIYFKKFRNPVKEYRNNSFWVNLKYPYFTLKSLNPDDLYKPRSFLWFPNELAPKKLQYPKCVGEVHLNSNDFSKDPMTRRITDIEE
jgi:hypothetical protein